MDSVICEQSQAAAASVWAYDSGFDKHVAGAGAVGGKWDGFASDNHCDFMVFATGLSRAWCGAKRMRIGLVICR